jgi:hypothetical protein
LILVRVTVGVVGVVMVAFVWRSFVGRVLRQVVRWRGG